MPVDTVLFIRHGETDYNRQHRMQGALPIPLNARGRKQAAAVAEYLADAGIGALYSSPLSRALATAQAIGKRLCLAPQVDARLGEIAFGDFEGLRQTEAAERHPEAYRRWQSGYLPYTAPNGESRVDVSRRMQAAFDDVLRADAASTAAIVGHGSAIVIFLGALFVVLPDGRIANTSITTLRRDGEIWEISGFGETPHLRD